MPTSQTNSLLKKIALAGFVVVCFALYSFRQRNPESKVTVPNSTSSSSSTTGSAGSSGSSVNGSSSSGSTPPTTSSSSGATSYKNGQYTGSAADAYYGIVQVRATIAGSKITDVTFLQYPNDRANSIRINSQAMPYLQQEAIQAQTAQVDIISGATDTSQAFIQSLSSALSQAQ